MYKEWYRLETHSTSQKQRAFPFDLVYMIPKKDLDVFKKTYDVFMTLTPTKALVEYLLNVNLHKTSMVGITRKFTTQTNLLSKSPVKDHLPAGYLDDCLLCIPSLPRKKGSKMSLSYMVSREVMDSIEANHNHIRKYAWTRTALHQDTLGDMELHYGEKSTLPCAICASGMQKAMDPMFCTLGMKSCLERINLKNVESFTDKATKTEPEVTQ